jgi:hypothetical protein
MTFNTSAPAISTGNPMIDMAISMLLGNANLAPGPGRGQGIYDAFIQKERSKGFIRHMQSGFADSLVMQKLGGINTNTTMGGIASMLAGHPDGIMDSRLMRAFNGGNPVKALMGLNANMTGMTMGMAFGRNANASDADVKAIFNAAQNTLFEQKRISQSDIARVRGFNQDEVKGLLKDSNVSKFFSDVLKKDDKGETTIDFQEFKRNATEYAEKAKNSADKTLIDAYEEVLKRSDSVSRLEQKLGQGVATRVDAKMARGYQLDDLTKTFTMAADLGMIYEPKRFDGSDYSVADKEALAQKYFSNAGKVLRSVSDLTGTQDAVGAQEELNALLGTSAVNLTDSTQANEVENLLRRFKGAARSAGISIEAIMGILSTSKALVAEHSELRYAGGMADIETSIKAVNTTAALVSNMGGDWVRRQGGQSQLMQDVAETMAGNRTEPIVKQMSAWASAINESTHLTDEQKEAALQRLSAAAKNGQTFSPAGFNNLVADVSRTLGVSTNQALGIGESFLGQQAGAEFMAKRDRLGKGLGLDAAAGAMTMQDFMITASMAINDDGIQIKKADGSIMTKEERIQAFLDEVGAGAREQQTAQKYGLDRSPELAKYFDASNPLGRRAMKNIQIAAARSRKGYQGAYALQDSLTRTYADEAARMAEKYAKLQSPLWDTLAQELAAGTLGKGFQSIADIFMTDESRIKSTKILDTQARLSSEDTNEAFKAAFMAQFEGTDQGKAMSDSELSNLTDISKQLDMNQIMAAAKQWKGSRAEQLGLSRNKVEQAAKFLSSTGIGSTENLRKYGAGSFNSVKKDILLASGLTTVGKLAAEEQIKEIGKLTDKQLEDYVGGLQDRSKASSDERYQENLKVREELLGVLDEFGLVSRDRHGSITDIDTQRAIRLAAGEESFLGEDATAEGLAKQFNDGSMSATMSARLEKEGIISRSKSMFRVFGVDDKLSLDQGKLQAQANKERAARKLANQSYIGEAVAQTGEAKASIDKSKEMGEKSTSKAFQDLHSSLSSSSQDITKALERLNNTLMSFTGGG